ncbi:MAG TPA: hypothetical protein VFG23_05990 [Polyangia bacterium]|nr:hypothetical protein [Polyangia bacterium]
MRSVVTGLMMLAGSVVREKGQGFDDFGWRREMERAREAQQIESAMPQAAAGTEVDSTVIVVAGPPIGTADAVGAASASLTSADPGEQSIAPGDWDVACERGEGNRLMFDRDSVRELGGATLFRWAPVAGAAPQADGIIYTAVADCREKSVEASWPGKRRATRSGTCGRFLVDAVCSTRSVEKTAKPEQRDRNVRPRAGAPHASATP